MTEKIIIKKNNLMPINKLYRRTSTAKPNEEEGWAYTVTDVWKSVTGVFVIRYCFKLNKWIYFCLTHHYDISSCAFVVFAWLVWGLGSGLGIHTVNLSIRLWVISVFAVLPHSIRLMYLYQRLEIYVSGHVGMRRHEPNEQKTSACTHSLYLLYMRR